MSVRVVLGSFFLQVRTSASVRDLLYPALAQITIVAAVGWIVRSLTVPHLLISLFAGTFFATLWRTSAFRGGWILSEAYAAGTLEIDLLSPARLPAVLFGRILGIVFLYTLTAAAVTLGILLMATSMTVDCSGMYLAGSLVVGIFAVLANAFLLIPISFLTGGLPGFFNAILPGIVILSGFLHPTSAFHPFWQALGRVLSTTSAMAALRLSTEASPNGSQILEYWAESFGLSACIFVLATALIISSERKLRSGLYSSFSER
ncbi:MULTISPECIES: hypothetical protein [unclassified Neorhizobium]|uniref:hypothetical protein n=1 Tax=unclassified Neorhizobium TaxID=2629175 RepID=UPI001FF3FE1D|nr:MULTISPECIES: hypothetical protein [unclassified Neorhizobium]MCJ9672811.1 hypothetical protein [Neorhizobium sp. SHOUNA12B]MCJ9748446.1 hypothetical protein [Neorhizobium sp. SHOUNA12A]